MSTQDALARFAALADDPVQKWRGRAIEESGELDLYRSLYRGLWRLTLAQMAAWDAERKALRTELAAFRWERRRRLRALTAYRRSRTVAREAFGRTPADD